jgi:hypothetical protein
MTIDVEAVYIDIEFFYLFKMGVRKEGAQVSQGGWRTSFRAQGYTKTWRQFSCHACSHTQQNSAFQQFSIIRRVVDNVDFLLGISPASE